MRTLYRHTVSRQNSTCHSNIRYCLMMLWLLLATVLTACSDGSDSNEVMPTPQGPAVLNIYVFAPGQAVPTRGNEGQVDANPDAEENAVKKLQIWVFKNSNKSLVTYFETTSLEPSAERFELPIPSEFATAPEAVDVFVLANVSALNCGLTLGQKTTHAQLEAAVLQGDYFGLSETPVTEVPFEGLPMSGVIRNQSVTKESEDSPILYLGAKDNLAKVKLARAVSKVRFVFSCSTAFDALEIVSITFKANMIPKQEYLFLEDPYNPDNNYFHINTNAETGGGYNDAVSPNLFPTFESVRCEDPAHYAWDRLTHDMPLNPPYVTSQDQAEAYEELINEGLSSNEDHAEPRLTERRVYLRESDKQLEGTITYRIKDKDAESFGTEKTELFLMLPPGIGDTDPYNYFSRNHTWIVFSYLAWAKMNIVAVHVDKWQSTQDYDHTLYNW